MTFDPLIGTELNSTASHERLLSSTMSNHSHTKRPGAGSHLNGAKLSDTAQLSVPVRPNAGRGYEQANKTAVPRAEWLGEHGREAEQQRSGCSCSHVRGCPGGLR